MIFFEHEREVLSGWAIECCEAGRMLDWYESIVSQTYVISGRIYEAISYFIQHPKEMLDVFAVELTGTYAFEKMEKLRELQKELQEAEYEISSLEDRMDDVRGLISSIKAEIRKLNFPGIT